MEKGVFCISVDTELLWGRKDLPNRDAFIPDVEKEREIIEKLLKLLKQYQIPATWAVVGEIFNPGDSLWHGPDIIKMIKAYPNQEIACHSFSHQIFDEKEFPFKKAGKEIRNCLEVANKSGIKLKSFVFPKNIIGHLEILKKYGFTSFRGPEPYWFRKIPKLRKMFQILDFMLLLITPPVSHESKDPSGLINIPGSMYFISTRGLRKFIPQSFRLIRAKKGIIKAIKNAGVFHLWFHPIDFARNTEKMFLGLEEVLKYATELRSKSKLEIKSMNQITEDYLKN